MFADERVKAAGTPAACPSPLRPPAIRVVAKMNPRVWDVYTSERTIDAYGAYTTNVATDAVVLPSLGPPAARHAGGEPERRPDSGVRHRGASVSRSVPTLSTLLRRQFHTPGAGRPPSMSSFKMSTAMSSPGVEIFASRIAAHHLLPLSELTSVSSSSENAQDVCASATSDVESAFGRDYAALASLAVPPALDSTFVSATAAHTSSSSSDHSPNVADDDEAANGGSIPSDELPDSPLVVETDEKLSLSPCGFFRHHVVVEEYSLLELYRIRCWQLGVKRPDPRVEAQLPSAVGKARAAELTSIDLRATYIGSVGCLALAAVIPFCTSLRSLTLTGVGLVDNSLPVYALLHACRCCRPLLFLDLSYNRLGDTSGRWLLQLCHACPQLRVVRVEHAALSDPLLRKLQLRLSQRDTRVETLGERHVTLLSERTEADGATPIAHSPHASVLALSDTTTTPAPGCSRGSLGDRFSAHASPRRSQLSSWRATPPHTTRLSYATPVRTRLGAGGAKSDAHAIGYHLLGSAGTLRRLGRSGGDRVLTSPTRPTTARSVASLTSVPFPVLAPTLPVDAAPSSEGVCNQQVGPQGRDAADPADVAAWIRGQRTKERIAASLQHATDQELYDHTRHEDLNYASQKRVPEFVAAALVELRRRLARNGHAMQRIYECFLFPDEFESQIKMGSVAMTADGEVARRTLRRTHVEHKRRQRSILRSDTSTQHKTEALVHMELLQSDAISSEVVRRVQKGLCSWKAFFRGLRILGIDSAATDLSQATRFASVCGVLKAEHVCFGKLIRVLRPHAVFQRPAAFVSCVNTMMSPLRSALRVSAPTATMRRPTAVEIGWDGAEVVATASVRTRQITWETSPPHQSPVPLPVRDGDVAGERSHARVTASAHCATDITSDVQVRPTQRVVQPLLDRLFDARHALRRALTALTLDPNHYSTLLFQTARSLDSCRTHDSIASDEWIVLGKDGGSLPDNTATRQADSTPTSTPLCQWPQSNALDRSLDTAVNQRRRTSMRRNSAQSTETTWAALAQQQSRMSQSEHQVSSSEQVDAVRSSMTDSHAGAPHDVDFMSPLMPNSLAMELVRVSVKGSSLAADNVGNSLPIASAAAPSLLVPYRSVLQTCVAALGAEHTALLRAVLTRCFSGQSPFVTEDDDESATRTASEDIVLVPFDDADDRLVDAERDLLQSLSLPPTPPAPPADAQRAAWRALNVAELQRLIEEA